jgi:molecular chaperone DnaK
MDKYSARPVGIDLGTTYSSIAFLDDDGDPQTVLNEFGKDVTPSAVYLKPDRSIVVGEKALEARRLRPDRVAVNFKRDMGERLYHETVGGKEFSPEALSALVIKKLAKDAAERVEQVTGAVITVPAYFGDAKRKATQDAGRIAGLRVLDIINEPTAAALANAFQNFVLRGGDKTSLEVAQIATRAPSTTLVYDLGGGTFDVTIIRIDSNDFEVVATGGEIRLGGVDFDNRLVDYFCDEHQRRFGVDPRDTPESLEKIRATCELAKIALSNHEQTIIVGEHLGKTLQLPLSRTRFEQLTADLLARTQISTEMLLEDALLTWDKIDNILLVGGSSRMPRVARMLADISGKMPEMAVAPQQIVAYGAAIHAAILALELDHKPAPRRTPAAPPTNPGTPAGNPASPGAPQKAPADPGASGSAVKLTFVEFQEANGTAPPARAPAPSVTPPTPAPPPAPPPLAPAIAAVAKSVRLHDVNSHGVGVIVRSSRENRTVNSVIIPKNTPLPATRVKLFGTEAKNQRQIRLRITEGQTRDPRGCTQIGECLVKDLPKGLPKGAPVEVSFTYDKSGRIQVRAVELTYGTSAEVELNRAGGSGPLVSSPAPAESIAELDVS